MDLNVSKTEFRNAMARVCAPVNVITTNGPAGRGGFTATAMCSVTDEPPTLLVCMNSRSAQTGLFIECLILGIPGIFLIAWLQSTGAGHFTASLSSAIWLAACGPMTAIPLMLFSWAARRIPFSAMGFLQFIAPSMTFVMGVLQGETFTPLRGVSFGFIWCGAAIFAYGAWRRSRLLRTAAA